jgi:ABC-type multidrug transport system fused ATPase/permease subunit
MFRDKVALHQYVLFGVMVFLVLLKVLTGNFIFGLELLWWFLGAIIGFLFVFSDRFVYSFLMKPEETLGKRLKDLFAEKKFTEGLIILLNEKPEQKELVMRSFLFLIVWLIMALLTVTSVSSVFARGFMLGIGIHLVFDLIYDYFWNHSRFDLWFWQIKREVSTEEKRWFVILVSIIFGLLAINF